MATAALILIGIAILLGVWYNGRSYSDAKNAAAARKAEAEQESQHVDSLEEQRALEAADQRAKDLLDAEKAAATADTSDGIGFLRGSFKTRR
jgi:hypothetical protein